MVLIRLTIKPRYSRFSRQYAQRSHLTRRHAEPCDRLRNGVTVTLTGVVQVFTHLLMALHLQPCGVFCLFGRAYRDRDVCYVWVEGTHRARKANANSAVLAGLHTVR